MSRTIESGSETTFDLVTLFTLTGLMLRIEVFRLCLLEGELPQFDAMGSGTTPFTLCRFSFPMPELAFDSASSKMEKVNLVYS